MVIIRAWFDSVSTLKSSDHLSEFQIRDSFLFPFSFSFSACNFIDWYIVIQHFSCVVIIQAWFDSSLNFVFFILYHALWIFSLFVHSFTSRIIISLVSLFVMSWSIKGECYCLWCRSLFVPYFKYLLESCIRYLTDVDDAQSVGLNQRRKKAKVQEGNSDGRVEKRVLAPWRWHLRALILSSFHKCFVYDTGSLKFLDSSNFQASQYHFFALQIMLQHREAQNGYMLFGSI